MRPREHLYDFGLLAQIRFALGDDKKIIIITNIIFYMQNMFDEKIKSVYVSLHR